MAAVGSVIVCEYVEMPALAIAHDCLRLVIACYISYGNQAERNFLSFVSSNEPVKNGCEVMYEMFHILNCSQRQWLHSSVG